MLIKADTGRGMVAGLPVVFAAVILDRIISAPDTRGRTNVRGRHKGTSIR